MQYLPKVEENCGLRITLKVDYITLFITYNMICIYIYIYLSKELPLEQCFFHVRLAAFRLRAPETQHRGYKHHSCLLVYGLRSTLDQDNPAKSIQRIRESRHLPYHPLKRLLTSLLLIRQLQF